MLLPIYIDTYSFIKILFQYTAKFSRDYKYLLGQSLNMDTLHALAIIKTANRDIDKQKQLKELIVVLDRVQIQVRLAADLHLITVKQQAHIAPMLEKIITQAVAWQRSVQKKEGKT